MEYRSSYRCWFFLLVLMAGVVSAQESEEHELKSLQKAEIERYKRMLLHGQHESAAGGEFDVTYYALDLRVYPETQSLAGKVTVQALVVADGLAVVALDLRGMTVDSVLMDGQRLAFVRRTASVEVTLPAPLTRHQTFRFDIFYRGMPQSSGFGSFAFSAADGLPWVWTLSEPYGARDWWPCKDHPSDKADSLDVRITCPSGLLAASQGKLIAVTTNGDGTVTYHWRHRYPIATYLVSLAIAKYAELTQWFRYSPADSMEIKNYVIPGSLATAQAQLPHILPQLEIFSDLFGLYPFVNEKYGHAQFGWGGGMEHQTITSVGGYSENLLAHELAHQWFGDMITMNQWADIWLNEGFATYSVALYRERRYGAGSYASYISSQMSAARAAVGSISIRDTNNISQLFNNNLVYAKGATVLHMLRFVLGDSAFFRFMKQYATDPQLRFANASTADVKRVSEAVSGVDLSFFFDQWIYGSGYPRYVVQWKSRQQSGGAQVEVRVVQEARTESPTYFIMPVELRFESELFDTTAVVWVRSLDTTFTFNLSFSPLSFKFDPRNQILKDVAITHAGTIGGFPQSFFLSQNFPNPFNASTTFVFDLPQTSYVRIEIVDILGRTLHTIVDKILLPGSSQIVWRPDLPSGVYFARMVAIPQGTPSQPHLQTVKAVLIR
jgi:aminopeptidase N